jgi:hypothetical protein
MAMGPRINAHLALSGDGKTVAVKGPTGDWEPYAESATFAVIIGQVNKQTGAIVLAEGRSDDTYTPNEPWWDAEAEVFDPANGVLVPGQAAAWGIASVKMQNNRYETFEWSVMTRLIDTPPLP